MIDTHCHLLPGLDDGPVDEREAVELARAFAAEGIALAVCTPHYSRAFPTDHAAAEAALERLRQRLSAAGVALELALAAEVAPVLALDAPAPELARRALAGRFLLVEITPDLPGPFFAAASERLAALGLTPILAHPERSRALGRSLAPLEDAREAGAVVQVVAPSLAGRWDGGVAAAAWEILDEGLADLVASDAHGLRRRRLHLRAMAFEIERRLGPQVARRLTEESPARVVRGLDPL